MSRQAMLEISDAETDSVRFFDPKAARLIAACVVIGLLLRRPFRRR